MTAHNKHTCATCAENLKENVVMSERCERHSCTYDFHRCPQYWGMTSEQVAREKRQDAAYVAAHSTYNSGERGR